jgi:hypothetical protein
MNPEEAIARARAEAERKQAAGAYEGDPALAPSELDAAILEDGVSGELLREWAVIETDPGQLYSTRRFGAPVTLAKRALLRLLRQHFVELESHQTRFNLALVARLDSLEARLRELEQRDRS